MRTLQTDPLHDSCISLWIHQLESLGRYDTSLESGGPLLVLRCGPGPRIYGGLLSPLLTPRRLSNWRSVQKRSLMQYLTLGKASRPADTCPGISQQFSRTTLRVDTSHSCHPIGRFQHPRKCEGISVRRTECSWIGRSGREASIQGFDRSGSCRSFITDVRFRVVGAHNDVNPFFLNPFLLNPFLLRFGHREAAGSGYDSSWRRHTCAHCHQTAWPVLRAKKQEEPQEA